MSQQLDLITGEPAAPPADPNGLTGRQQLALEFVAANQPVSSDELGAAWCEHRGKHSAETRCDWDGKAGREMGSALRKRGLVKFKRDSGWVLPDYSAVARSDGYDPASSEIPF